MAAVMNASSRSRGSPARVRIARLWSRSSSPMAFATTTRRSNPAAMPDRTCASALLISGSSTASGGEVRLAPDLDVRLHEFSRAHKTRHGRFRRSSATHEVRSVMEVGEIRAGRRVNVARTGPCGRPPILFIHAVSLDLTWWDHQFAALGTDHDLVALDLPGHGLSPRLDNALSFDALASVVADVIASLDAGPAHVVGISVGGMVAQTLVLARPDLVRSLTLVATLCTLPAPARAAMRERARVARADGMTALVSPTLERWFPSAFRERRPDVLDRAGKSVLRHDPIVYAKMWEMIAGLDLEARISDIACPTLVVAGAQDGNAPVAAGQRIADLISGAALHALPGVGHFPPVEAPAAFNDLLRAHLDNR